MKKVFYLLFALVFGVLTACEGPAGPQGPQGEQGEKGETGATGAKGDEGNANVHFADITVYSSSWTKTSSTYFYFDEYYTTTTNIFGTGIADYFTETMEGAVIVYIWNNNRWEALPFSDYNSLGELVYTYTYSWTAASHAGTLQINYIGFRDNNASHITSTQYFRVVWIPAPVASEKPELLTADYATIAELYDLE